MGDSLPVFVPSFNPGLHIEARPDRLSADGGAVLLREVLEQSGIISWLAERLADSRAQDQIDYPLQELLRTVLVLYGQGWRDQDDADALRLDPALRLAISEASGAVALSDGCHLPSQPTLSRLLEMLGQPANRRVLQEAVVEMASRRVRATRRGGCGLCAFPPPRKIMSRLLIWRAASDDDSAIDAPRMFFIRSATARHGLGQPRRRIGRRDAFGSAPSGDAQLPGRFRRKPVA
jgi:hypothetical protein